MAFGSVPAAVGGVCVVSILRKSLGGPAFDKTMLYLLAAAIGFTGIVTLIRTTFLKQLIARERDTVQMQARPESYPSDSLDGFPAAALGSRSERRGCS